MAYRPAITSMSLGRAWVHDFGVKMREAADAGFQGIEVFYEDLEYLAKKHVPKHQKDIHPSEDEYALLRAAQEARDICDLHSLTVIGLQPFLFYEGLLDPGEHEAKIKKLKVWFELAKILGTDIIQIPSNFQSFGTTGDLEIIVGDMIEVADLGIAETPPIRFAYESMCWSTHVDTWETMWEIVKRVDRPNFGCCLDSFHIAGKVWADPTSITGKQDDADEKLGVSLANLVRTVEVEKVFYVQVVDAERMTSPLIEGHPFYVEGQPPRMSWSRNARLFVYEEERGGYLPVVDVAKAFLHRLGYTGWVSVELFSRTMSDPSPDVPQTHAQRGYKSWQILSRELELGP